MATQVCPDCDVVLDPNSHRCPRCGQYFDASQLIAISRAARSLVSSRLNRSPNYSSLAIASALSHIVAVLCCVGATVSFVSAMASANDPPANDLRESIWQSQHIELLVSSGCVFALSAVVMFAIGGGCAAIRDIAKNSFR